MAKTQQVLPLGDPEISRPDPARLIFGNPEHRTWLTDQAKGLWCGVWQSTPGKNGV